MSLDAVCHTLAEMFTGVDLCLNRKLQLPALTLIYSGIDSLGKLAAVNPSAKVVHRFTGWVDQYLLPMKPLGCRSIDLYSARCGILHSLTADSDLIRDGKALSIHYAWGNSNVAELQQRLDLANPGQCIALHVADLAEGLRLGAAKMFNDADHDSDLGQRILDRSDRFFIGLTTSFTPSPFP